MFLKILCFFSVIVMVDSTQEILTPITNNVLSVISENADIEINDNVRSFIDETAIAESGGEENPLVARNPLTNAMGKFQFIESENNDSVTTGLNRLSATKEDGSFVYFEDDGWAEDKESYKLDAISKGFSDDYTVDVMDRKQLSTLINFISTHEMGLNEYLKLEDRVGVINKGIDMAYDYVTSDDYSLKDLVK